VKTWLTFCARCPVHDVLVTPDGICGHCPPDAPAELEPLPRPITMQGWKVSGALSKTSRGPK
jgi:hypothetical protein